MTFDRMALRRYALCGTALAALTAGQAQAAAFNIPAQPAAEGITQFARQAGVQILAPASATAGKRTAAVVGVLPTEKALDRLLEGAGLEVVASDGHTITLAKGKPKLVKTQYLASAPIQLAAADPAPLTLAAADPAPPETAVEGIVVTGSRLQPSGFNTPTPVTVVGTQQMQQRSAGTVFEIFRDIPSFRGTSGPSANSTGAQSASKANLDLRGLGATRTLVLINGRRHVVDGTGNVFDTNLIPTSLIDRVDIVTGGASAAYGSDAVAGAVNFVMKNRFEGLQGDLRYGLSQRGDNLEYNASFAYGRAFLDGRLHFVIGGDATWSNGTGTMYARAWGRKEPGILTISAAAMPNRVALGLPANIISNNIETSAYNASGLITSGPLRGIAFADGGVTYPLMFGSINGGTEMIGTGNYGSVENPDQFLRAPYERKGAMTRLEFDIDGTTTAFAQLHYGYLRTHGRSFGARIPNFNNYPVQITNPFLPPQIVAAMRAANITSFNYSATRHEDLGSIESANRTETWQGDFGVKGKIFGDWDWDVGGDIGGSIFAPNIHNTPRTADFFHSAYVVAGPNGQPACGPVATDPYFNAQPAIVRAQLIANLSPNCTPYNIFGDNIQANQGALAYFNSASQSDFNFRQYVANANLTGEPFDLPAGPVSVAVGAEWRKEKLSSVNCFDCQRGALMNQNYSLFSGQVTVKEVYGEIGLPLLRDAPFFKSLDFNGAARRTDYSTSGGVTTWKVGGTWDVNDALRLRATRSHDIRAPNINELFNPGSEGNPNIVNRTNNVSGFTKSNTIGNPDLRPETGETFTAGVVFQPTWSWASGFRLSVDYWNIRIKDVIATLGVQDILDEVLVRRNAAYEQYVVRDTTPLGISRVNVPQLNLNALRTNGIDVEVAYRVPLESFNVPGRLQLRALGTWIDDQRSITATQDIDSAGTATAPSWSWNFVGTYSVGKYSGSLMARYVSKVKYSATLIGPDDPNYSLTRTNSINRNLWPEALYFNAFGQYEIYSRDGRTLQIYGNIDNIFDKDPPIVAISINGSAYDLIGRSFKVGLRFGF